MRKRRYEILLPVRHNDGRLVSDDLVNETLAELVAKFRGVTLAPHTVLGIWLYQETRFEEEMRRMTVDVDEISDHETFFLQFKAKLLERFEQIEIYIASFPVDIL